MRAQPLAAIPWTSPMGVRINALWESLTPPEWRKGNAIGYVFRHTGSAISHVKQFDPQSMIHQSYSESPKDVRNADGIERKLTDNSQTSR